MMLTTYPPQILALSDPNAKWSAELGLAQDLSAVDFGTRTKRYALVIDDLKVTYVGVSRSTYYPQMTVPTEFISDSCRLRLSARCPCRARTPCSLLFD